MKSITIEIAINVAPSGFPTWRRREAEEEGEDGLEGLGARVVLRRKSWVIAMPIEAKEREVRSQARKVRSGFC